MTGKKYPVDNRIDYSVALPVFLLLLIGLAATYIAAINDYPNTIAKVMTQQAIWILLGCDVMFVVMLLSTEFLWKMMPPLYGLRLILMVLPLIFYSPELVESTGARNRVIIGSVILFQPSESMKVSHILMLARYSTWFRRKFKEDSLKSDWKLFRIFTLITLPVVVLLGLQRDLGTAMIFSAILTGLILLSRIPWWIILSVTTIVAPTLGGFMLIFLLPDGKEFSYGLEMDTYQVNHISAWLDPFSYAKTVAYQQTQEMISIGSGGLTDKGFNVVDLSVPVRESDMVFTVITEGFGFIGSTVVMGLYLLLIYRVIRVTFESNNRFCTYISTSFIMMILSHIFESIGAAVGILPLTGIPLPFISQGNSSLITNLICVGLILSMSYQNSLRREQEVTGHFKRSDRY